MRRLLPIVVAGTVALLFCATAGAATRTATPSTLGSVFAASQPGDTIELAAGSYAKWGGGSKTAPGVTLRPAAGAQVAFSVNLGSGVSNVRLDGFQTLAGELINGAKNVTISNSKFTSGLAIIGATSNIVLDGDTFADLAPIVWEGRLSLNQGATGVTVKNSVFSGNAKCSDGVFVGNATGNTIGPGNEFKGIKQGSCGNHTDSIQLYDGPRTTITGNYFHDDDTIVMAPDGGDHSVITNNVMVGSGYQPAVQMGHHDGTVFAHNTTKNIDVNAYVAGADSSPNRNIVLKDNVVTGGTLNVGGCVSCTVAFNLFGSGSVGSNALTGTPVFAGGVSPASYVGWALTSGSLGKGTASDGTDRGINVIDGPAPPPDPIPGPDPTPIPDPTPTPAVCADVPECVSLKAQVAQVTTDLGTVRDSLAAMTMSRDNVQAIADAYKARAEAAEDKLDQIHTLSAP